MGWYNPNLPRKSWVSLTGRAASAYLLADEEIKRRYEGGESTYQIGESLGVSSETIRRRLIRMKVIRRDPSWRPVGDRPGRLPAEEVAKLRKAVGIQ